MKNCFKIISLETMGVITNNKGLVLLFIQKNNPIGQAVITKFAKKSTNLYCIFYHISFLTTHKKRDTNFVTEFQK